MQTVTCEKLTLIEEVAKTIYNQWENCEGWVPWVEGGNSIKQDDARDLARKSIELSIVSTENA